MSAIAGIYFLDGRSVDRADLERMLERVAHRGPDGRDMWSEGASGLGHRMLWTTPESLHEELPLTNKTGGLVLTADARIDNRDEIIANLGLKGRPQDEITDSELILQAYEQWDERCPEKLLGDFAFAIWDRRRQVLFCARDHFGVKPFYYHYRDGCVFVFASEIKALLCLPEVPCRLNETRVADYLVPMLEDKVITFYQDILRLPPAHTMIVSREGVSVRPYWALDPSRELRLGSNEEYAEAFLEIFTDAVRCRLRSAFPVGSMLSGGLDSSSIVCVARQLLAQDGKRPLHTFSAIFDDVQCDERPFINAVIAQERLEPHFVRAGQLSPLGDLDRVLWHQDEPFYAPNLFVHWALCNAAHQQGTRVLMDGLDGDTTLAQRFEYLAELLQAGRWKALTTEVIGLSRRLNNSPWRIFFRYGVRPLVPEPVRQVWRMLSGRSQPMWAVNAIITPDFAQRIGMKERIEALLGYRLRPARTSREDHWRRLFSGLNQFVLEVVDRSATAFSIEPRYPFFDRRLVEFCLALPPNQKLSQGWTRVVMRRALDHVLPGKVRWRGDKWSFIQVFTRGMLALERRLLEETVLNDSKTIEVYVDMTALRETYYRYVSQGTGDDALTVWKAVTLALWLRQTSLSP